MEPAGGLSKPWKPRACGFQSLDTSLGFETVNLKPAPARGASGLRANASSSRSWRLSFGRARSGWWTQEPLRLRGCGAHQAGRIARDPAPPAALPKGARTRVLRPLRRLASGAVCRVPGRAPRGLGATWCAPRLRLCLDSRIVRLGSPFPGDGRGILRIPRTRLDFDRNRMRLPWPSSGLSSSNPCYPWFSLRPRGARPSRPRPHSVAPIRLPSSGRPHRIRAIRGSACGRAERGPPGRPHSFVPIRLSSSGLSSSNQGYPWFRLRPRGARPSRSASSFGCPHSLAIPRAVLIESGLSVVQPAAARSAALPAASSFGCPHSVVILRPSSSNQGYPWFRLRPRGARPSRPSPFGCPHSVVILRAVLTESVGSVLSVVQPAAARSAALPAASSFGCPHSVVILRAVLIESGLSVVQPAAARSAALPAGGPIRLPPFAGHPPGCPG